MFGCYLNKLFSLVFPIILFIIFIPGWFFTLPPSYKDKTDIKSKLTIGAVHGIIYLIITFICIKC